jgi:CheY-like chemotaxis protein
LTARTVLKHQLNQFDVVVESACDGSHALELLRSHIPDVIFLDHIMPGLDGFQVLERLKKSQSTKGIPVVMYTSQAAPQYTIEAKLLGAIAVIPKKVTNEQLMEALDKAELYQLSAANTEQDAIADANAQLTEALNKAEVYQFRVAGAEQTSINTAANAANSSNEKSPVSRLDAERSSACTETESGPEQEDLEKPNELPPATTPAAAEKVQAGSPLQQQHPVRGWLLALVVAILALAQGYSALRNQKQQSTFNTLHQQALLQQKSFNKLRLQVIEQQQIIDNLRLQVVQQEDLVPEMQAQLASEQRLLAESTWRQMEFLMTVLMDQVRTDSGTE